jgi:hypothetical protein
MNIEKSNTAYPEGITVFGTSVKIVEPELHTTIGVVVEILLSSVTLKS